MERIETSIEIHATPEKVWGHLVNFEEYPDWNPFIRSIQRDKKSENHLNVTIQLPDKKPMKFRPEIEKYLVNTELRWKGKLFIKGIFDGEHYFILEKTGQSKTRFIHGEEFRGILPSFLNSVLKTTKDGFELMNLALKTRCESD